MRRAVLVTTMLAAAFGAAVFAQSRDRRAFGSGADWCADGGDRDRAYHCEVREATIGGANPIEVDAGRNGGIRVRGSDRGDVLVRSRVSASATSDAEARQLVAGIRIDTTGGSVRVVEPDAARDRDANWSVSFELLVPRNAMLTLTSRNGGISIEDFGGTAKFQTTNGGISLSNVGGDLRGETTNGGVNVDLNGDHWDGQGLDLRTRNGAVRMSLPSNYSAALETGTAHGRINIDFPITLQGQIDREVTTTLGGGGAKIRAVTTNGGVTIRRK